MAFRSNPRTAGGINNNGRFRQKCFDYHSVWNNADIGAQSDKGYASDFFFVGVIGFEKLTHPKFEVYADKAGEFRFRLKARNGEVIAVSEGYKAKASCLNGIESVQKNAPEAEIVEE